MQINLDEALRYLGISGNVPDDIRIRAQRTASALTERIQPRYCYRVYLLSRSEDGFTIPEAGISLSGNTSALMLSQCNQIIFLACTLGTEFDALLRAEEARDMADAVILDACGSALVEAGCDQAGEELSRLFPDRFLTDRFSPGYGDLPLSLQPAVCTALNASRRLGLSVTDHFLLNPIKSVVAMLGVSDQPQRMRVRGCSFCSMYQACPLRKGGMSCAV